MRLKYLELTGFKSFAKKTRLDFDAPITAVVGPNGSGKSNIAEAFRWVLGEQSLKSLRGRRGEDMIFNGGGTGNRLSRASVSVIFDNSEEFFDLDFDEVALTRMVYRDGVNEYAINGSQVRLKDVIELLAKVSLGASGHQIISQGEADRILNTNLAERRMMIEDALGLKIYHWKIGESEKKLSKTEANIKEVESLRREIAPHLKFLKKQVEKVEKAAAMRRELKGLYLEYFFYEDWYLAAVGKNLAGRLNKPQAELAAVQAALDRLAETKTGQADQAGEKIAALENELRQARGQKDELARNIGRLEGIIEIKQEADSTAAEANVPFAEVDALTQAIAAQTEAAGEADAPTLRRLIKEIKALLDNWREKYQSFRAGLNRQPTELDQIKTERDNLAVKQSKLIEIEKKITDELRVVRQTAEKEKQTAIGAERELYELKIKRSELNSAIGILKAEAEKLVHEKEDFRRELAEAAALVDQEVKRYAELYRGDESGESAAGEAREKQAARRKSIERLKIRLEDIGLEGEEVMAEFKQVTGRDEFLARELEDLYRGAEGLKQVMNELKDKLSAEFNDGIKKINDEFQNFFALMFGGGTAALKVVKEEKRRRRLADLTEGLDLTEPPEEVEEAEEGIEIAVNLPRKKIKGLEMLSGGERALTSIALLFALSQVNPPPFLVLDETDAALDEANSCKYGDMIESLAKHSQLILITHNRETMSRAGILYGVTMDSDGVSKFLSIKFDQAESYAK